METVLNFGSGVGTLRRAVVRFTPVDGHGNASRIESGSGSVDVVVMGSVKAEIVDQTSEYIDVAFEKGELGVGDFTSSSEFLVNADGDLTGGVSVISGKVVCTHVAAMAVGLGAEVIFQEVEQEVVVDPGV
jgi:hypothetical protein